MVGKIRVCLLLLSENMDKRHIFLTLCIVGSIMCYISYISTYFYSKRDYIARTMAESLLNYQGNESHDAPGCTIPTMEPFHESIRHLYTKLPQVRCPGKPPLTYISKQTVFVNQTALKQNYSNDLSFCLCRSITRRKDSDNHYNISQGIRFVSSILACNEFLKIECFDNGNNTMYTNLHAIVMRKKPHNTNTTADRAGRLSLLLLAIDSVSRMNHIRQFPQTRSLLQTMKAVELTGYNKVGDNTFVNIVPLLTGETPEALGYPDTGQFMEKPTDHLPLIWKNFSHYGYLTAFIEDSPQISAFNLRTKGFIQQPTDYYPRPISYAIEQNLKAHCVKTIFEPKLFLDYTADLVRELRNDPYFTFLFLTKLSHEYLNEAGLLDEVYHSFLETIHKAGYLHDTMLIFFSDHGIRFGEILQANQGYLEERLPFMFILPPPGFKDKYPLAYKNLYNNHNKLTTPFDIHATLEMILRNKYQNEIKSHGATTKKGVSLFSPISSGRSCADADIPAHYCTCQNWTQLTSNSTDVRTIAKGIVMKLNEKITRHSKKCAQLSLHSINAAKFSNNIKLIEKQVHQHHVFQVQTEPGFGLFDVSVWVKQNYTNGDSHGLILLDDAISRINKYGNQSWCVHVATLKKLCYCADLLN